MIRRLRGSLELELYSASLERCLNRWVQAEIPFWDLHRQDALTAHCRIYESDLDAARREAARAQTGLRVLSCAGLPRLMRQLWRRPVLLLGVVLALVSALLLQNFVWFLRVQGNETVSAERILQALSEEGVRFGTWGPDLDSEDLKNRMLNRIPELRWLAVNREGGLVTVLTAERKLERPIVDRSGITNVVATRPGIIQELHVTDGVAVVEPGDSVQAGDVLISGFAEWTTHVQAMHAAGEVTARTMRQLDVICPDTCMRKVYTGRTETCRSIIFQRKRRKISGNSSIFGMKCDRMIETSAWTLPGGFSLPVFIETQTLFEYTLVPAELKLETAGQVLCAEAERLVTEQMVAGEITRTSTQLIPKQDSFLLRGTFHCVELISKTVPAELYGEEEQNGENNQRRTN